MSDLSAIYKPWGGNAEKLAADISELGVTVRQWRTRGSIPPRYWQKIIDAATERGHALSVADFPMDQDMQALAEQIARERAA